jgi:hypothetical protein
MAMFKTQTIKQNVLKARRFHQQIKRMVGSGFGGLGVVCRPLVPKFAGSNPAEADGFLGRKKSSARLPSERK